MKIVLKHMLKFILFDVFKKLYVAIALSQQIWHNSLQLS